MIGRTFHRLTVIEEAAPNKHGHSMLRCVCVCGEGLIAEAFRIKGGKVKSCGCLRREVTAQRNTTHGLSKNPVYRIWANIKTRCLNPNSKSYVDYGERGIGIADEWANDFHNFYAHIGDRPSKNHYVDRIDNNKGYEPGNVRWVSSKVNNNNRRDNHILTWDGQSATLAEWEQITGLQQSTIRCRISRYGWTVGEALGFQPKSSARVTGHGT